MQIREAASGVEPPVPRSSDNTDFMRPLEACSQAICKASRSQSPEASISMTFNEELRSERHPHHRSSFSSKASSQSSQIHSVFSSDSINRRLGHMFSGTLEKRGYWNPSWKKRYFVLTKQGVLEYYSSDKDFEAGARRLGSITVALPEGTTPELGRAYEARVQATSASSDADGRFLLELDVRTATACHGDDDDDAPPRPSCTPRYLRRPSPPPSGRTYVLAAPSALTRAHPRAPA
eukprot:CAMPEP_0113676688 /NCGR_PEP_ID=MMETSP0038_2-20120614/8794_1 /TAXON_ID=2898 /ORGANISM="Cryptomonas paramecium" /LENGTH=234 /DNA_ID=CAMNT_0000593769 /DNA_START=278 /DNA_END=979 /DNA_ORIENTATION=+ /assembly_acc=CAM_ASM_000170